MKRKADVWGMASLGCLLVAVAIFLVTFPSHGYGLPTSLIDSLFYSIPVFGGLGVVLGVAWIVLVEKAKR